MTQNVQAGKINFEAWFVLNMQNLFRRSCKCRPAELNFHEGVGGKSYLI